MNGQDDIANWVQDIQKLAIEMKPIEVAGIRFVAIPGIAKDEIWACGADGKLMKFRGIGDG